MSYEMKCVTVDFSFNRNIFLVHLRPHSFCMTKRPIMIANDGMSFFKVCKLPNQFINLKSILKIG